MRTEEETRSFVEKRRQKRIPSSTQGRRRSGFARVMKDYDLTERELISLVEKYVRDHRNQLELDLKENEK